MLKRYIYPYVKIGKVKYPIIEVKIGDSKFKSIMALVDSGANISVFKRSYMKEIGIDMEDVKEDNISGVGGKMDIYIHEIKFEVAGRKFKGRACFAKDPKWRTNILGRLDVFNKFHITFIEEKEVVIFEYKD